MGGYSVGAAVLEYLSPENPIAQLIVSFLFLTFLLWIAGLVASSLYLMKCKREIEVCSDVEQLREERIQRSRESDGKDGIVETEASLGSLASVFLSYCESKSINERSPIARHLRAVFFGGFKESRLEIGELLAHSTSELFPWNSLFRSVLTSFVVIGLLGTLFGLADSLAGLTPMMGTNVSVQSSQSIVNGLKDLLTDLKSAFAPSIWGIALTVAGIFFHSVYLRAVCQPVKGMLEYLTLTEWVPQLFPTTAQKLIETIQQNEQQIVKVQEVIERADTIAGHISDFERNVQNVNQTAETLGSSLGEVNQASRHISQGLSQVTGQLGSFGEEFGRNVGDLVSFQGELRALYNQILVESSEFRESSLGAFEEQNRRLEDILGNLVRYQEAYSTAVQENAAVGNRNIELLDHVQGELREGFTVIGETIRDQFGDLARTMQQSGSRSEALLSEAATRLTASQETFDRRMTEVVGGLQREFERQNENNSTQLVALGSLNEQIVDLLTHLNENSQDQGERLQEFSTQVVDLKGTVTDLNSNIEQLPGYIDNLGHFASSLGTLPGPITDLAQTIERLPGRLGERTTGSDERRFSRKWRAIGVAASVTVLLPLMVWGGWWLGDSEAEIPRTPLCQVIVRTNVGPARVYWNGQEISHVDAFEEQRIFPLEGIAPGQYLVEAVYMKTGERIERVVGIEGSGSQVENVVFSPADPQNTEPEELTQGSLRGEAVGVEATRQDEGSP